MKKIKNISLIVISLSLISCAGGRMTYEDVQKEISEAEAAQLEAKKETNEAIDAREQYYRDYQATEIEKHEKSIKSLNKQIDKIERQKGKTTNKDAAKSLDNAISSLKSEKKDHQKKISELKSMTFKDWSEHQEKVNSNYNENNEVIIKLEESLDKK